MSGSLLSIPWLPLRALRGRGALSQASSTSWAKLPRLNGGVGFPALPWSTDRHQMFFRLWGRLFHGGGPSEFDQHDSLATAGCDAARRLSFPSGRRQEACSACFLGCENGLGADFRF
eukprot:5268978-Prorocentrum_lima.AAC.1